MIKYISKIFISSMHCSEMSEYLLCIKYLY